MMTSTISSRLTRAGWALTKSPSLRPPPLRGQGDVTAFKRWDTAGSGIIPGRATFITFSVETFRRALRRNVLRHRHRSDGSGRPCDCLDCMEAEWRPHCGLCRDKRTVHQELTRIRDGTCIAEHVFTRWCEDCWEARLKRREEEQEEEREEQKCGPLFEAQVNEMLEQVRKIEPGEQVPISYAVRKYMDTVGSVSDCPFSQQYYRRNLHRDLGKELRITKVGRRYMCDKGRVDAMNFKLWWFGHDPGDTEGDQEKSPIRSRLCKWMPSGWLKKKTKKYIDYLGRWL